MRTIYAAILILASASATAQENPSTEQILGAIAGGALGSTVGDGDGKTAATVVGAIIGYRMGEKILNPNGNVSALENESDFRRYCRKQVPEQYANSGSIKEHWVRGCIQRLQKEKRELERQAYEDGLNGPTN